MLKDQRQKFKHLAQMLSKCTTRECVVLTLLIRALQLIIWIENQLWDFILCIFFNLLDVAYASSYIVYHIMHPSDILLLDFKTIALTYLSGRYTCRVGASPDSKIGSKRKWVSVWARQPTMWTLLQRRNWPNTKPECWIFLWFFIKKLSSVFHCFRFCLFIYLLATLKVFSLYFRITSPEYSYTSPAPHPGLHKL